MLWSGFCRTGKESHSEAAVPPVVSAWHPALGRWTTTGTCQARHRRHPDPGQRARSRLRRRRQRDLPRPARVHRHRSRLRGRSGPFDLLVDYGTLDDLDDSGRDAYVHEVVALTRPGTRFLLWCFEWTLAPWERAATAILPCLGPGIGLKAGTHPDGVRSDPSFLAFVVRFHRAGRGVRRPRRRRIEPRIAPGRSRPTSSASGACAWGPDPATDGSRERMSAAAATVDSVGVHGECRAAGESARGSPYPVLNTHEEERRRLRSDLHDELGATLAGLTLKAGLARSLIDATRRRAKHSGPDRSEYADGGRTSAAAGPRSPSRPSG